MRAKPFSGVRIITAVIISVFLLTPTPVCYGQETLDQTNNPTWTGGATNISPTNKVSQIFMPSLPCLVGVEVALKTGNRGRGGDQVTLKILGGGGQQLSSTSANIPEGFDGFWRFNLPGGGISVTPGKPVTVLLQDTGKTVFWWKYNSGNPYPAGPSYFYGSPFSNNDFFFKTYGKKNCESLSLTVAPDPANLTKGGSQKLTMGLSNPGFELGNLEGWKKTGTAFDSQPTYGENVMGRRVNPISVGGDYWTDIAYPIGVRGNYWIGTFEKRPNAKTPAGATQGDLPTGTLTSANFMIPTDTNFITFLIGGGNNLGTLKIELLAASGATYTPVPGIVPKTGLDSELLRRDWWSVGTLDKTKDYAIRITDNATSRWGHINVDDIRFEKTDPRTTRLADGRPSVLQTTIGKTAVWTDYDARLWGAADMHTHLMGHMSMGGKLIHGAPDLNMMALPGTIKQGNGCNTTAIKIVSYEQALPDCSATHGGWGVDNTCGDTIRAIAVNVFDGKNIHKIQLPHEAKCDPGMEMDAGLCYNKKCKSGYHGLATMCHKDCPSGFRDDILFCGKPAAYGRGTGYVMGTDIYAKNSYGRDNGYSWDPFKGALANGKDRCLKDHPSGCEEGSPTIWYPKCRNGYKSIGLLCFENCRPGYNDDGLTCRADGLALAKAKCERENAQGCEQYGLMYYPKCRAGFHAVECCVCSPNCPPDMTDMGVSCQKNGSEDRGIGKLPLSNVHGDHKHAGYPTMAYWPHYSSKSHQQMFVEWIRRAHEGGLNVLVALALNNELFAEVVKGDPPKDDRASADRQLDEIHKMIARHPDFMREVKTAAEFRAAVKDGKLAVIVGVELDNIGGFNVNNPNLVGNEAAVKREIQRLYYEKGVRYILPLHFADNIFGGVAIKGGLFNLSNRFVRTRPLPIGLPFPPGYLYKIEKVEKVDPYINFRLPILGKDGEWATGVTFTAIKAAVDIIGTTPFPPAFDAIKCPIPVLGCVPQFRLVSSLLAPDPEWDLYQFVRGGHVNQRGLQSIGEVAIKEMMRLGMFVDIDHMSDKTANRVLEIANGLDYPVNSGHTGFRYMPGQKEAVDESSRTAQQLAMLGHVGGIMGVGWGGGDADFYLRTHQWGLKEGTKGAEFCKGKQTCPGPAYSLGSDINGLVDMPKPRMEGKEVLSKVDYCPDNNDDYNTCLRRKPNAMRKYAFGTMASGKPRYWDYNSEGVAHIGLYPDFYQDMKNAYMQQLAVWIATPAVKRKEERPADVRESFFSAADAVARMWDKMEVRKAFVK
jgi:microsomal dipeptidase-like Zn-dependent dipeptidase